MAKISKGKKSPNHDQRPKTSSKAKRNGSARNKTTKSDSARNRTAKKTKKKPSRTRRKPLKRGTNTEGHRFTRYGDGSYSYRNFDPATGRLVSTYFNTGAGADAFYRNLAEGYGYHEDLETGERKYFDVKVGKKWRKPQRKTKKRSTTEKSGERASTGRESKTKKQ